MAFAIHNYVCSSFGTLNTLHNWLQIRVMNSILLQIRTCKVPAAGGAGVGRNQIDHYHEGNKRNQGLRLISALMGRL